jgi:hypothetical protein
MRPGHYVRLDTEKENLDIIDIMLNTKYFRRVGIFSCPQCYVEFESENDGLDYMLQKPMEAYENMEEKNVYWLYE